MKLHHSKREVEVTGASRSSRLTIAMTPEVFRNFIDRYSDKEGAVVREIIANAIDAHGQVGKRDIPFQIHSPNKLEPFFKVRDFGPGMSENFVYDVFCSLGSSTKTHTDDQIGGFGVGSKAPFCYTDNFTVTSWHAGTKSIYALHIDAEGFPAVTKLHEETSDEESGVEVSVPILDYSIDMIRAKIDQYTKYLAPLPLCNQPLKPVNHVWRYGRLARRKGSDRSMIIVGGIPYDWDNFAMNLGGIQTIPTSSYDLYFEIGEVEIASSREKITINEAFKREMEIACETLGEKIKEQYQQEVEKAQTVYEAHKLWAEWAEDMSQIRALWSSPCDLKHPIFGGICENLLLDGTHWTHSNRKLPKAYGAGYIHNGHLDSTYFVTNRNGVKRQAERVREIMNFQHDHVFVVSDEADAASKGIPIHCDLESIALPPRMPGLGIQRRSGVKIYRNGWRSEENVDFSKVEYYCVLEDGCSTGEHKYHIDPATTKDITLYGIPKRYLNKVKHAKTWDQYYEEESAKHLEKAVIGLTAMEIYKKLYCMNGLDYIPTLDKAKQAFFNLSDKLGEHARWFGPINVDTERVKKVVEWVEKTVDKYPLLKYIGHGADESAVKDYIRLKKKENAK